MTNFEIKTKRTLDFKLKKINNIDIPFAPTFRTFFSKKNLKKQRQIIA